MIKPLEAELAELTQIIVANKLAKPALGPGEDLFGVRSIGQKDPPRGDKKGKQAENNTGA